MSFMAWYIVLSIVLFPAEPFPKEILSKRGRFTGRRVILSGRRSFGVTNVGIEIFGFDVVVVPVLTLGTGSTILPGIWVGTCTSPNPIFCAGN